MKQFICDKCGKASAQEIDAEGHCFLWEIRYNQWTVPIAEVCDDCRILFDEALNQFFGKQVIKVGTQIERKAEK